MCELRHLPRCVAHLITNSGTISQRFVSFSLNVERGVWTRKSEADEILVPSPCS